LTAAALGNFAANYTADNSTDDASNKAILSDGPLRRRRDPDRRNQ
jgi:hypothetical protein